ncbi:MAG: flavin reductase family protein [Pleomorphochaeta sp.]|jgi:flavin reductase (DIM6/NTAB) family NADH-FMN oxidoreductase RutF
MKKEAAKKNSLAPKPNVLVSCKGKDGRENALAVAYAGNCSYDPPMLMVGIVPSRFSYHLIKESGVMVVNIVPKSYANEYKYLGTVSGRDEDKLKDINTEPADLIDCPMLSDCPVNVEGTIVDSIMTGSHEMFIVKVEKVHAKEEYLNESGNIDFSKIDLL